VPIYDLAIIQIPKPDQGRIPTLSFGDSDRLRPGDDVIAIGNPLGLDQTVTRGIISGLNRILPERPFLLSHKMIQTDTAINPGNSGGPLLNRCGEVIGINSQIISGAQSIGFAIPSNLAKSTIPQLMEKGRVIRPWLGFDGQILEPELRHLFNIPLADGLLVEAVEPGSPADAAGIQGGRTPIRMGQRSFILGGDIVLSINGISLANIADRPASPVMSPEWMYGSRRAGSDTCRSVDQDVSWVPSDGHRRELEVAARGASRWRPGR